MSLSPGAEKPVARLFATKPAASVPTLGADLGALVVPDDFNAPLPDEVIRAFEGGEHR